MTIHDPITAPVRAKLRVEDFLLLADAGAFVDNVRTELLDGEIWVVNAVHSRHARTHAYFIGELHAALKAVGGDLILYDAPSTLLSDHSLPEPDIAVARLNDERTLASDLVRIAIEIADLSLTMDLGRKARLYATAGIPEYWVVDVEAQIVHQHWSPAGEAYGEKREVRWSDPLESASMPDLRIDTSGLQL